MALLKMRDHIITGSANIGKYTNPDITAGNNKAMRGARHHAVLEKR